MRFLPLIVLSCCLLSIGIAAPEKFVPTKHDSFVGDWLPKNPGDYVAQVFATGDNAYQANILLAFDDESSAEPVAVLHGTRPDEKSPVSLNGGDWTGALRPDCCGSPQMEIVNSKTGQKTRLAQYMRPNPRLQVKPPKGANARMVFTNRMRDGVRTLDSAILASETIDGKNVRAHIEFRLLSAQSAAAVTLWKDRWIALSASYGRAGAAPTCGALGDTPPTIRAERAILEWQALDIERRDGRATIFLNGVKIHDNVKVADVASPAPLKIETRGAPIELRNAWIATE
ncbi:hypothetical protein M2447_000856 [Ereboglobus sp. PH5-10]|uniref:family 16 glycoside hydrolase n=1 Tax=Ereboglobus sp. PH5-10 TaxID=2940629 RepID=UPI002405BEF5|nr:family 16 glycoside hydrolase [Ereboglobus sp. PH5-10]MDF9826774.1 hypothetical protein [Ereboglobus sp. PH5-10]